MLGINVFGDGVRDALDPRAKVRIGALTWARFVVRRLVLDDRRAVRDLGPDVPDLPGDPQRRPGAAAGRAAWRRRRRSPAIRAHVGLRQADLRPVPDDDEARSSRARSISYTQQVNVLDEIKRDLPATLSLAIGAGIIWLVLGHRSFGVLSALTAGRVHRPRAHRAGADRRLDAGVPPRRDDALLPRLQGRSCSRSAATSPLTENPWQWLTHLILPWFALSVLFIGVYSRVLRSTMLDTMQRGLRAHRAREGPRASAACCVRHVLRNSLIPIVSLFGLDFAAVIGGGAILTESVFNLHGVGQYAAESIQRARRAAGPRDRDVRRVLRRRAQRGRRRRLRRSSTRGSG